jgi:hypothetical protein
MYEKEKVGFKAYNDFGDVFLEYLQKQSVGFKVFQRTHATLISLNYEWENNIEVLVNPDSSYYYDFFTKPWTDAVCKKLFNNKSLSSEMLSSTSSFFKVCSKAFKNKVFKIQQ